MGDDWLDAFKPETVICEDKYEIEEFLNRGAFGAVFKVHLVADTKAKRAVKVMLRTQDAAVEFLSEVNAYKAIPMHKNITKIMGSYDTPEHFFLVMTFYKCGDLTTFHKQFFQADKREKKSKIVLKQVVSGLHHCSKLGIIHRDIKPSNILVKRWDPLQVVITDFNFAEIIGRHKDAVVVPSECGTLPFKASEYFEKNSLLDFKCDIWAAGVMCYWMLSKYMPFEVTPDETEYLRSKYSSRPDKLERERAKIMTTRICKDDIVFHPIPFWANYNESAKEIIHNMLCRDRTQRIDYKGIEDHAWLKTASSDEDNGGGSTITTCNT